MSDAAVLVIGETLTDVVIGADGVEQARPGGGEDPEDELAGGGGGVDGCALPREDLQPDAPRLTV